MDYYFNFDATYERNEAERDKEDSYRESIYYDTLKDIESMPLSQKIELAYNCFGCDESTCEKIMSMTSEICDLAITNAIDAKEYAEKLDEFISDLIARSEADSAELPDGYDY